MTPLVTVLMPVYNGEKYLKEAIDSILNQTFKDFEFLIINDGSTDNSVKIIKSYKDKRIRLVSNKKNIGLIESLNKGINDAKGKYIARMDADDISEINRLKIEFEFLENNTNVVMVGSNADIIDVSGKFIKTQKMPTDNLTIRKMMLVTNCFFHGSVMIRKNILLKSGLYNVDFPVAEDYELWTRMIDFGCVNNIDEVLYRYRINPNGESLKKRNLQQKSILKISKLMWQKEKLLLKDWNFIWPKNTNNVNSGDKLYYQYLHVQFAKKYRIHLNFVESIRHIFGSIQWIPISLSPYFYLLMWIMPMRVFCVIEEFLLYNLFIKKNSQ